MNFALELIARQKYRGNEIIIDSRIEIDGICPQKIILSLIEIFLDHFQLSRDTLSIFRLLVFS